MEQQSVYKKQEKMTFLALLMELPNLAAVTVSAVISQSLLVWLDFVDSLGNVLSCSLVAFLSHRMTKDLRYTYNYGIGKVEAMTALFSEGMELCGLLIVGGASIRRLAVLKKPSDFLIWVVVLKAVNAAVDAVLLKGRANITKSSTTYVTHEEYLAKLSAFLFDAGELISVLGVWLMREYRISWYISPVLSLGVAICMFWSCLKHLRKAISALLDETLPEKDQMKILKALSGHHAEYDSFGTIKSRNVGTTVIIDISVSFSPDTTFKKIEALQKQLQAELAEEIQNCRVSIVINDAEDI